MYAQLQHSCQHSRSSFDVVSMKGDLPNVSTRLAFWFTDSPVSQYLPSLRKHRYLHDAHWSLRSWATLIGSIIRHAGITKAQVECRLPFTFPTSPSYLSSTSLSLYSHFYHWTVCKKWIYYYSFELVVSPLTVYDILCYLLLAIYYQWILNYTK